ncbi:hypothetical protein JCM8208_006867 [Rhodotorula glutinis]
MQRRLSPGDGLLRCSLDPSSRAHLSDVQFSYPLKVIVPARRFLPRVQCAYIIGYGGGLVAGDRVRLKVEVDEGATLVLLTQGSTKVFKVRPGRYLNAPALSETSTTQQLFRLSVAPSSTLVLLPAPVTCFSRARYTQRQVVRLADASSSLVLLDWYTCGRMGMAAGAGHGQEDVEGGEEWEFERYRSENEVWLGERRIAKDVLLLEDELPPPTAEDDPPTSSLPHEPAARATTYRPRVAPYSCYATLFLFGPSCAALLASIEAEFAALVQHKQRAPFSLVWSYSPLALPGGLKGGIARCAGDSTEAVREWVTHVLGQGGIEDLVSRDLWKGAFS